MIDFDFCSPWFWFMFSRGYDPLIDRFTHEEVPITGSHSWGAGNLVLPSQVSATIANPDTIGANKSIYFYVRFKLGNATGLSEIIFAHYNATFTEAIYLTFDPGSGLTFGITSGGFWILNILLNENSPPEAALIREINEVSFHYNASAGHYKIYLNGQLHHEADIADHAGIAANAGFAISPFIPGQFDSNLTIYDLKYGVQP